MPAFIVIGASTGGVVALQSLTRALPKDLQASIFVVLHIGSGESILPSILNDDAGMRASHASNGERICPSHIYIAPPDQHLLIAGDALELSRGPRENFVRPAVDPLFRSAAETFGPDVIGVILTGRLNDGSAGLFEIKRRGGLAIVQDPGDAEAASMPQSALDNVAVDYCVPLDEIAPLLVRLVTERLAMPVIRPKGEVAMPQSPVITPSAQTCPECGGAMREERLGKLSHFRCHIGHMMTAENLAAGQLQTLENDLSAVFRLLNERSALCRDMASKYLDNGNPLAAQLWKKAADESAEREVIIKQMTEIPWTRPEERQAVFT